jgi:hypothetical protein
LDAVAVLAAGEEVSLPEVVIETVEVEEDPYEVETAVMPPAVSLTT